MLTRNRRKMKCMTKTHDPCDLSLSSQFSSTKFLFLTNHLPASSYSSQYLKTEKMGNFQNHNSNYEGEDKENMGFNSNRPPMATRAGEAQGREGRPAKNCTLTDSINIK